MPRAYIGTSGWQYKGWKGIFYPQNIPQKDWLRYYAKHFNTVEVNSSFYRQTKASTFKKWKAEVGTDFTFSIKGVRFITHVKRLKDTEESVGIFSTMPVCSLVRERVRVGILFCGNFLQILKKI